MPRLAWKYWQRAENWIWMKQDVAAQPFWLLLWVD